MIVTFGMMAIFCGIVIWILQRSFVADKSFSDYVVGGRSFGGFYQAMSFLNTWYPGAVFVAFAGLSAGTGVLGFYPLSYSLLTVVLMYLMARRVWIWGSKFDLHTQPDLFALRYESSISDSRRCHRRGLLVPLASPGFAGARRRFSCVVARQPQFHDFSSDPESWSWSCGRSGRSVWVCAA